MENKNNNANSIGALIAGAAVGIGVAVAGALALSEEKNRKKMKKVLDDLKEMGDRIKEDVKDVPKEDKVAEIKKNVEITKQELSEKFNDKTS